MSHIEIITVGDELVEGRLVDSNAAHLSDLLTNNGLTVVRHTSVGDDRAQVGASLKEAASRSDAVIVTGGLGPTTDDLTAECAAQVFNMPLERDPQALAHVERFFASRGREMAPNNRKQADLPRGSELLPNPRGTAVGFKLKAGSCRLYFMPGVPSEMAPMFEDHVLPDLRTFLPAEGALVATLRIFGIGESDVGQRLEGLDVGLPEGVGLTVQYRATVPEIAVRLLVRGSTGQERAALSQVTADALARLQRHVFAWADGPVAPDLAEVVLAEARRSGARLAVAESCTGGLVGGALTAIPGSSEVFMGGVIAYADDAKRGLLDVPASLLAEHGAVSGEVAEAMARGALARLGATHAVAVTGIAGPGGGTEEKPVGTVWFGIASPAGVSSRRLRFPFDRERIRAFSVFTALTLLRRSLTPSAEER